LVDRLVGYLFIHSFIHSFTQWDSILFSPNVHNVCDEYNNQSFIRSLFAAFFVLENYAVTIRVSQTNRLTIEIFGGW